ncbi:hypothetical protein [Kribbella sp. NPDC048915]|uniref:hypothetical protein n=1 Tax=Kribbella sp. NPDC048915 TaxID=3155148 RepID=UPI0033F8013D
MSDYEGPIDEIPAADDLAGDSLPAEADPADVLEQRLAPTAVDERPSAPEGLPAEADPADVEEQRREVGGDDDEDAYR